jgi:Flp pilus assembly protein TadD
MKDVQHHRNNADVAHRQAQAVTHYLPTIWQNIVYHAVERENRRTKKILNTTYEALSMRNIQRIVNSGIN